MPLNFGGVQQLVRFTLPYSVNPAPDRYADGLGDLTIFDLVMLPTKPVLLAVGPLFVAPTATDRFTGAGRWQAGAAGAAVSVSILGPRRRAGDLSAFVRRRFRPRADEPF